MITITQATVDAVLDQLIDADISVRRRNERNYAIECLKTAIAILEADDGMLTERGAHLEIAKILTP